MKKKVYADYHGPRCTREHDGKTAQWKYYGTAKLSHAEQTDANHNADCINAAGLHDLAALSYPLVGMQSQKDPDYIEYQILTAKLAHIDGFFVEWGFKEHASNEELLFMIPLAKKYGFEIGINWCDAWHFYQWIEAFHPEAVSREEKVELSIENVQYLMDTLFADEVGANIDGHPLILLFGGGFTVEEFLKMKNAEYRLSEHVKKPYFLKRANIVGEERNGQVQYQLQENEWENAVDGVFGWIPTRVRDGLKTDKFRFWDFYATTEDAVLYLDTLHKAKQEVCSKVGISSVNPEMDNRACASWNKFALSHIPRNEGRTYEEMWKKNIEDKSEVDIVYIVSWNDYTERHQIEPTLTDGYREMEITRKYAAAFKELSDAGRCEDFQLPLQLFRLRKQVKRLGKAGFETNVYQNALDQAAFLISERRLKEASLFMNGEEQLLRNLESQLVCKQIVLTEEAQDIIVQPEGIEIRQKEALQCMDEWAFDSWLSFSYAENSEESFRLCHRQQELCDIKMDGSGQWKKTKIRIYCENIENILSDPILRVQGNVQLKEVSLVIQAYRSL